MTSTRRTVQERAATERDRPVDASMTLLKEFTESPLDPGYAEAATRAAAGEKQSQSTTCKIFTILVLGVLTALVTVAVVALRAPQAEVDAARSLLENNIQDRNEEYSSRKTTVKELQDEIRALQSENLSLPGQRLLEASQSLGVATGTTAVEGPGVVIEMRDAKPSDGETLTSADRVQDFDLQVVVNGLWAAGSSEEHTSE